MCRIGVRLRSWAQSLVPGVESNVSHETCAEPAGIVLAATHPVQ